MMRALAICLLVIGSVALAQDGESAIFKSVYAPADIALETDPHSAFWRDSLPVYAEVDIHGAAAPAHRTEVRSRWTNNNLYLLYTCPYHELYLKPAPDTAKETNQLWNWDVAELFIGSDPQHIGRYKEFEVSPQGEWVDLDINADGPIHNIGWNSGFQVAARIDRKAAIWYGAMRIPFSAIYHRTPSAGILFRANLFRTEGPPGNQKLIAWKAPMSNTFHIPERFGQLELAKGK
ncbi:MAG: carbohydrate-binding family 9-like protein [Acidobacteriaceae bacterium]